MPVWKKTSSETHCSPQAEEAEIVTNPDISNSASENLGL